MASSDRHPGGRARGFLVLATTGAAALALALAASSPAGDPELLGRAELARRAGEVEDGLVAEWERFLRAPEQRSVGAFAFAAEAGDAAPPETRAPVAEAAHDVTAALLVEASQRAARDELAGAEELLLRVLERAEDPALVARGRLLALQLALRTDDTERARRAWAELFEAADSGALVATQGGVSVLLLACLAAQPVLELDERVEARERLVRLLTAGELMLPPAFEGGGSLVAPGPQWLAYRRGLDRLLPEAGPDARVDRYIERLRRRELEGELGDSLPAPDDVRLAALGERELLYWRTPDPTRLAGRLAPRGTALEAFEAHAEELQLVPRGFAFDVEPAREREASDLRTPAALAGSELVLVVRHEDPEGFVARAGERQGVQRIALLALAALSAGAGFVVFRALERERRLQALKSAFVASVSHELRTPVSSILLLAENLEGGRAVDPARCHGLIRREAERLRRLVDDVLDFSSIERGKPVRIELRSVATRAFAESLRSDLQGRVAAAGARLEFSADGIPARLTCDAEALRRAVQNLVENSLVHSGVDAVEVHLGGTPDGGLEIRVRDRGRGIPRGRLDSVFEPFERGSASDSVDPRPGTGLGLAIVRELARAHRGQVSASAPADGPGVLFELSIPSAADMGEEAAE